MVFEGKFRRSYKRHIHGLTIRTLHLRDGKGFLHSVQFTYDPDGDGAVALLREAGQSIRDDVVLKYNLQGPLEVFGVDKMDRNGVVLTAQFRAVSGGQYAVSRAFNQRLKKLVDNCPAVHFAQTYPQPVLLPQRVAQIEEEGALPKAT